MRTCNELFTTEGTEEHRGKWGKLGYRVYSRCRHEGAFRAGPRFIGEAYQACLTYELRKKGLDVKTQVELPVIYESVRIDLGYRIDLLVNDLVIVELKCVEKILPVHEAQIISYLRLSRKNVGLLINFHVRHLRDGIKRFVEGSDWNQS